MPPLQQRGQLRWNTEYSLLNEPHFRDVTKRWILNRISSEQEYKSIYAALLVMGVNRRDILSSCFDADKYSRIIDEKDKQLYLTGQNEGRNIGIVDGQRSGFEWILILDGNTFITEDSWAVIEKALVTAKSLEKRYMKIPYHRLHSEQQSSWLNKSTNMAAALRYAPLKGESQIAFHRDAMEMFSLGDTQTSKVKRKGYGARNKAYLFKPGAVCGPENEKLCHCASIVEGNEEDTKDIATGQAYVSSCGLIVRLWTYPQDELPYFRGAGREPDYWCFLKAALSNYRPKSICKVALHLASVWMDLSAAEKERYHGSPGIDASSCIKSFSDVFLRESCVRAEKRELALTNAAKELSAYTNSSESLCFKVAAETRTGKKASLMYVLDADTLNAEIGAYEDINHKMHTHIKPFVSNLLAKADAALKLGPYSVTFKTRFLKNGEDKRLYYSVRPYHWPLDLVEPDKLDDLKLLTCKGRPRCAEVDRGFVIRDGIRVPGSIIGGPGENYNDRASAWYLISNVTTLALAWRFAGDLKYAEYATKLVEVYFVDENTRMLPNLMHSQAGSKFGLIDWKDVYVLLDAFVLLRTSGAMTEATTLTLQRWCLDLARWAMSSNQGVAEARSPNNHGVYFDLTTLALSTYAHDLQSIDFARARLQFRLEHAYPLGPFSFDGSQPHETIRPIGLHYITFNLAGWFHCAQIVESLRATSPLPGSIPSLWQLRHLNDADTAPPVLLKAAKWLLKFLPSHGNLYKVSTKPKPGMDVNFPFKQNSPFDFDRMLELLRYAVRVYGVKDLFSETERLSPRVQAALNFPFYSTETAMMTSWGCTDPNAGGRLWDSLGLPNHFFDEQGKWYKS